MKVRAMRPTDIEPAITLGKRLHMISAFKDLPYDVEKLRKLAEHYIDNPQTRCALVAETSNDLAGFLGGYISEYYFCHEKVALDVVLYVVPEKRGSLAAAGLIRSFQQWAAACGASEVSLAVSTGVEVERTGRLYEKLGFTHRGGVYSCSF